MLGLTSSSNPMISFLWFFLLVLTSCCRVGEEIEPKVCYTVGDSYLSSLPAPFPPLSSYEAAQDWGREYQIARSFARSFDLYPAVHTFKRASFLLPSPTDLRASQIQYDILYCYYLGGKYQEVIHAFEQGGIKESDSEALPYRDFLILLYDSYLKTRQLESAGRVLRCIENIDFPTAEKLSAATALFEGDWIVLEEIGRRNPDIDSLLSKYRIEKISVSKAQWLNGVCPGAGYWYLGQRQTAITALVVNALFLWATVHLFQHGHYAAGAICGSLEAGWYFGGIYGVGLEGKFYNERVYERLATATMSEKGYFPILMLQYGF